MLYSFQCPRGMISSLSQVIDNSALAFTSTASSLPEWERRDFLGLCYWYVDPSACTQATSVCGLTDSQEYVKVFQNPDEISFLNFFFSAFGYFFFFPLTIIPISGILRAKLKILFWQMPLENNLLLNELWVRTNKDSLKWGAPGNRQTSQTTIF